MRLNIRGVVIAVCQHIGRICWRFSALHRQRFGRLLYGHTTNRLTFNKHQLRTFLAAIAHIQRRNITAI